jgi:hypothetical protein
MMRMRYLGVALAVSLLWSGCGKKPTQVAEKPKTEKKAQDELPGRVRGKGWRIFWRANDQNPNAKPLPVLIADAEQGELINEDEVPSMRLKEVKAKLFREGAHAANVEAAQIDADRQNRKVVGTGGVVLRSLVNPPNTVVRAETLTWDTKTDQFIAEGDASVSRPAYRGAPAMRAEHMARIFFSSKLDAFRVE